MTWIMTDASIVGPWVCALTGGEWTPGRGTALGNVKHGQLVGGVLYEDWNGANLVCHIAGQGRGWLDRQFLWRMFDYPFNQVGAKRLTGIVPASNTLARRFDEHLGFVQEAVLKDAHPDGDLIVSRMRRDECKWLENPHG